MKKAYLLFYIFSLISIGSCTECVECDNLYHEPTIQLAFLYTPTDSNKVVIKDTLGVFLDSINRQKTQYVDTISSYFLPLKMDSTETTFFISFRSMKKKYVGETKKTKKDSVYKYEEVKVDTSRRKITVRYQLEDYFYNDRLLKRALIDTIMIDTTGARNFPLIKDSIYSTSKYNNNTTIFIRE